MKKVTASIFFCCGIVLFLQCNGPLAGGGTETTNGISGTVVTKPDASGSIGMEIVAALYSIDYRPDSGVGFAESTTVSQNGTFSFDSLTEDYYNLFIWGKNGYIGLFIPRLTADTVLLEIVLKKTGTVTTTVGIGAMPTIPYEIIIPGTPFYFRAESDESVSIPFLPEGEYDCHLRLTDSISNEIPKTFIIDPAVQDTTVLPVP